MRLSPAAVCLFAAAVYFFSAQALVALALAAAVHELGHIAALKLARFELADFFVQPPGLCIVYTGAGGALAHALAAGPAAAAGLALAYGASYFGARTQTQWLSLLAGISLVLSLFNLLPLRVLDGGRIARFLLVALLGEARGVYFSDLMSDLASLALLALGCVLALRGYGAGLALTAAWLIISNASIEKQAEIM